MNTLGHKNHEKEYFTAASIQNCFNMYAVEKQVYPTLKHFSQFYTDPWSPMALCRLKSKIVKKGTGLSLCAPTQYKNPIT